MKLFLAQLGVARVVGEVYGVVSTGGSGTTLIATNQPSVTDDFFNSGTMFFRSGANLEKTSIITDYANTGRVFTVSPPAAVVGGVLYTACRLQYTRGDLVAAVNQALTECGLMTMTDESLLVQDASEEYTLPAGVRNVVKVQVALANAAPYKWKDYHYWAEHQGNLTFHPDAFPSGTGYKLRIYYNAPHPAVDLDADTINDYIWPERVIWTAAYYALYARHRKVGGDDKQLKDQVATAAARMGEMAARFPTRTMSRPIVMSKW